MKKVTCIAMYEKTAIGYRLHLIQVKHKTNNIELYNSNKTSVTYERQAFRAIYDVILGYLKQNNMYVDSFKECGGVLYDIDFINVNDPMKIDRIYYFKKVNYND